MNEIARGTTLTLEELANQVADELQRYGLAGASADNRVSAQPDARTIRYYTTLGLLDRPDIENRQARYRHRHVLQLLAIKALQGASLPLAEIQARLYGRSEKELAAIIEAVAGEQIARPTQVRMVRWREIMIEPGLKIMAEEEWTPAADSAALEEKIRAAIAALKAAHNNGR